MSRFSSHKAPEHGLQQDTTSTMDREHSPKPSNLAQDLLALQRTAGNRAVTHLLQRAQHNSSPSAPVSGVPTIVDDVLRSPGQPLDAGTSAFMEPRFGYDFSQVRVHTDAQAAESARAVNALAYTVGRNVVFGAGQYAPETSEGQRLMAHELSHVVQQQSTPALLQGKLSISSPSDSAERSADAAARAVMVPDNGLYRSSALQIRHHLRSSSLPYPTIQRAVKTWGGEYKTDKYELTKNPGLDGVDIELRFKPNKHVDAELIGMTQTARSAQKGGPVPAKVIVTGKAEEETFESYRIPAGEANAGTMIDQLVQSKNPLYATGTTGAKDTLSTTPTSKEFGQHGWHYTDKAGKPHERDALLKDTPALPSALKESSQVFESTALAIKGVQEGTFYGSVQWGWEKDAAGKVKPLPLTLVSNDVPSPVFSKATELWNKGKTSKGEATIDLPMVMGKYTNTQGVWLVSDPSHYKTTIIDMLAKNTRLEVTNKGMSEPFNKTADKDKWWKVTIVDGTHIGKVGWVMQADLSDTKTK
jgi:Domain of unknown function (DUF4157)